MPNSHFAYKNPQLAYKQSMASADLCCVLKFKTYNYGTSK